MRVTVIGGSGRTGRLVVEKLIDAGHIPVATIRNAKHMAELVKLGAEVQLVDLDTSGFDVIVNAIKGSDAVVFAAGSAAGKTSELDRKGTLRTVRAAEKAGVKRYVSISSIGASTGLSTRAMDAEMKDYYRQKRAAAKHIAGSSLDWTIVEPGELTDGAGTGYVTISRHAIDAESVPRADVASVVVAVLAEPRSIGTALQLTRGTHPIAAALKSALG
ncbi:NAD(P)-binding oxidoreductase [Devosia sp.]|uniref:NAD(P)-binding oxidoreductase n=1 Tax=Devosia sp. TaxID=1871048 RepID=UPI001AC7272A|nr:NAD(P)-binding oxidoreductase [Devosia sp.]MBN9308429.1 SDR family oxidoreductase [Devosia sp.]